MQHQHQHQQWSRRDNRQHLLLIAYFIFNAIYYIDASSPSSPSPSPSPSYLNPPKTIVSWVNGIGHNLDHMDEGQAVLSSIFGNPIHFCHNPTAKESDDDTFGYIRDLGQATNQKVMGKITDEVNALVKHLKESIQEVGPKGKVIHIAHSQGALITNLAAKNLTKAEMSQIEVICYGGAVSIHRSEKFPFARCVNYYSVNDPLLLVNPDASKALRTGVWGMGSGVSTGDGLAAMLDPITEPEFVFLTPRGNDPVIDHGLMGPTYMDALRWEGRRYQSLYLPIWQPVVRTVILQTTSAAKISSEFTHEFFVKRILVPIIIFVMTVNDWIKHNVIIPVLLFFVMLWDSLQEIIRPWKDNDVYEPVPPSFTNNYDTAVNLEVEKEMPTGD